MKENEIELQGHVLAGEKKKCRQHKNKLWENINAGNTVSWKTTGKYT